MKATRRIALLSGLLLITALVHAEPRVQTLLDEFSTINWDQRAQPVVKDQADTAWLTRVRLEHALIGLGKTAVPDLVASLDSPNRHVRALAAFCLGAIGDGAAVPPLIRRLSEDDNGSVRLYAAEALGRLGDPAAQPPLQKAAEDGSRWVVDMAQLATKRLADKTPVDSALQAMAKPAEEFASLAIPVVGSAAPDFDLTTHAGERVRLADFKMKKPVVVIFALANW